MPTLIPAQPGQQVARLVVQRDSTKGRPTGVQAVVCLAMAWAFYPHPDGKDGRVYPVTPDGVMRDLDDGAIWLWGDKWQSPNGDEPRTLEECAALHLNDAKARFNKNKPAKVWPVDRHGNVRRR